jgi:hypothetical protein
VFGGWGPFDREWCHLAFRPYITQTPGHVLAVASGGSRFTQPPIAILVSPYAVDVVGGGRGHCYQKNEVGVYREISMRALGSC